MMSQTGKKINLLKNKNNPGLKKFRSETRNVELKNTAAMRPRGFTLVEILLVVMLIGLAAGLAVPNFSGSFSSLQLRETAENLGYLMRYAQSRAIIRRQPCRLEFNIDNTKYWITQKGLSLPSQVTGEGVFIPIAGRLGRRFDVSRDVTVERGEEFIVFHEDGKIDKARIYLHNKKGKYFTLSTEEQSGYVELYEEKVE